MLPGCFSHPRDNATMKENLAALEEEIRQNLPRTGPFRKLSLVQSEGAWAGLGPEGAGGWTEGSFLYSREFSSEWPLDKLAYPGSLCCQPASWRLQNRSMLLGLDTAGSTLPLVEALRGLYCDSEFTQQPLLTEGAVCSHPCHSLCRHQPLPLLWREVVAHALSSRWSSW